MTRTWLVVLVCAVALVFAEIGFIAGISMESQVLEKLTRIDHMLTRTLPVPPNTSYAELVVKQDAQIEAVVEQQVQILKEQKNVLQVAKSAAQLMGSISARQDKREARQLKVEKRQDQFEVDLMNVIQDLEAQKNIEANRSAKPPLSKPVPRR